MPLKSLLGTHTKATLFTVVDKAIWEVLALHMVPHIGFGHMGKHMTYGARIHTRDIGNNVFVEILRFGNLT